MIQLTLNSMFFVWCECTQGTCSPPRPWHIVFRPRILSFLPAPMKAKFRDLTTTHIHSITGMQLLKDSHTGQPQELARQAIHPPTSGGADHFQKWNRRTRRHWPRRTDPPTWILDEFCCYGNLLTGTTPTEIGKLDKCQNHLTGPLPHSLEKISNL